MAMTFANPQLRELTAEDLQKATVKAAKKQPKKGMTANQPIMPHEHFANPNQFVDFSKQVGTKQPSDWDGFGWDKKAVSPQQIPPGSNPGVENTFNSIWNAPSLEPQAKAGNESNTYWENWKPEVKPSSEENKENSAIGFKIVPNPGDSEPHDEEGPFKLVEQEIVSPEDYYCQ